ncbi:hypothetical protein AB9H06_17750 [Escherichia coli]|nr:hypothetical protein [Escherichia coli]
MINKTLKMSARKRN